MSADATTLAEIFALLDHLDRRGPGLADEALSHAVRFMGHALADAQWERGSGRWRSNELAGKVARATGINTRLCESVAAEVMLASPAKTLLGELRAVASGMLKTAPPASKSPIDLITDTKEWTFG